MYLALQVEKATVGCFLENQLIASLLMLKTKFEVDLQVLGLPA